MSLESLRKEITLALREDVPKAARLAREFARLAARSGEPARVAEALVQRAKVAHVRGSYAEAIRDYEGARRTFLGVGRRRDALATDVSAVQALALAGRGREVRQVAARLRRARLDPLLRSRAELALGSAFGSLGDERAAEECFRNALRRLRRKDSLPETARARLNLGVRLAHRGETAGAISELEAALRWYRERGEEGSAAVALHDLGWARGVSGDALRALDDLRGSRESFLRRKDLRRAALCRLDEAELLARLGAAEEASREARGALRELARGESRLEAARAALVAARAEKAAGRRARARALAGRAARIFRAAGDRAGSAMCDVVLGRNLRRAEAELRRRGQLLHGIDALLALGPAALRVARRYPATLRRFAAPGLLRLVPGIAPLRRAVRAAEDLRRIAPTGALRASVLGAHAEAYEELAKALLARGTPRDRIEAFQVLDALRARTLRDEMERESPGLFDSPRVRRLRRRLEAIWRALEGNEGPGRDLRATGAPLLRSLTRCERALVREVERSERGAAAPPAPLAPPTGPCLAWSLLDGEVLSLLALDGEVSVRSCGPVRTLRELLDGFRFQVARRLHGAADGEAAESILRRLAARLLPADLPGASRPLRLLLPPEIGDAPLEALEPLRGRALFHAPGATGREPARTPLEGALLAAIDDAALPEVAKEIRWLRRTLPGAETVRGGREPLLRALPNRALIHIAGHARTHASLPLLSALRLPDGWVTAQDLREASLGGALVVLSACRTGDPSLRWRGEALGGFPRALLAAGASAVIASRWEVRDVVAHAWTRELYPRLATEPPHEALRGAAAAVRGEFDHPADWASFLVISGATLS